MRDAELGPRQAVARALRAGRRAGELDRPVTFCPYSVTDPREELLARVWVRGYVRAQDAAGRLNLEPEAAPA